MEGLLKIDHNYEVLSAWNKDKILLIDALVSHAPFAIELRDAGLSACDGIDPGCFDPDVSLGFGVWFAHYIVKKGDAPTILERQVWLVKEITDFFTKRDINGLTDKLVEGIREAILSATMKRVAEDVRESIIREAMK